jgi:hypothetical protein
MCLYLTKDKPKLIKAEKDVVCYKIFFESWISKTRLVSAYMNFWYTIGKLYKCPAPIQKERLRKNDAGYTHSIGAGCYHSFATLQDAEITVCNMHGHLKAVIAECIIPKGTRYYDGYFGGIWLDFNNKRSYASKSIFVTKNIVYQNGKRSASNIGEE